MPSFTNSMGLDVAFRADAVVAVADRDAESGAEITCVFGLGANYQKIREPVDGFLSRIGLKDKFAKFTRPNDTSIWINAPAVTMVTTPQPGLFGATTSAVIVAGSMSQAVKESIEEVMASVTAHGGAL
ncbi:MAG TPA: hypothetical protein VGL66_01055 [Caulobacteraceae bacterium]|jgi:hypothetical protein